MVYRQPSQTIMKENEFMMKTISIDESRPKVIVDEAFIKLLLANLGINITDRDQLCYTIQGIVEEACNKSDKTDVVLDHLVHGLEFLRYVNNPVTVDIMTGEEATNG